LRSPFPKTAIISDHPCHAHFTKRITPIKKDSTIPAMNAERITQAPFEPLSVRTLIMSWINQHATAISSHPHQGMLATIRALRKLIPDRGESVTKTLVPNTNPESAYLPFSAFLASSIFNTLFIINALAQFDPASRHQSKPQHRNRDLRNLPNFQAGVKDSPYATGTRPEPDPAPSFP
jgi:hypothetical protein